MESFIKLGYLGLFLATFLASTIVPLSSEIVLTGLIAADFDLWSCIVIATFGNFLGGITTYALGYLGKWEWIEKLFKKRREEVEKFQHRVQKIGILAAAFAWLPLIGDLISLSLGFLRFKPLPVFVMMLIGRFGRFVLTGLAASGIISHFF